MKAISSFGITLANTVPEDEAVDPEAVETPKGNIKGEDQNEHIFATRIKGNSEKQWVEN